MSTERLPRVLRNTIDLYELNRRVLDGEVVLDWSAVQTADTDALSALLADIDPVRHAVALGLHTLPEGLESRVAPFLDTPITPEDPAEAAHQPPIREAGTPIADAPASNVLAPKSRRALRAELEQAVLRDLLGPAGGPEEEVNESSMRDRYLVGMLAPRGDPLPPEQDDDLAVTEAGSPEDGQPDAGPAALTSMSPSSMGLTFTVAGDAPTIVVSARWGRYHRELSETIVTAKTGAAKMIWKREQAEHTSPPIPLAPGPIAAWNPSDEQPEVVVRGLVRRLNDEWIVTLFLVNGQPAPRKLQDRAWLFQAELSVAAPDDAAIFRSRPRMHGGTSDAAARAEQRALAMTYRRRIEFAIGHGISVHAETAPGQPERAVRVTTRAVPSYEVARTDAPSPEDIAGLANLTLDMKVLADTPADDLPGCLGALPDAYATWIATQRARIDDPATGLAASRDIASDAMAHCAVALARIREGIALLTHDAQAAEAFRFMNRAMWLQLTHIRYAEERRRQGARTLADLDLPANRSWRPFQLAFILINLPGITDLTHPDRGEGAEAVADLLWFPTGGGKTEAYLGLTAYTLAIRRLQGRVGGRDGEYGVAVLMRYTLRLLTLQQTQRASTLICACESIRRDAQARGDHRWGETPFRIGLWVGQRTTPNKTAQADDYIKEIRGSGGRPGSAGGSGSPAQLKHCPWCGTEIDPRRHIKVEPFAGGRGRTIIYCGDPYGACLFGERLAPGEGLPLIVVDEEIYRLLPALLIATVDKFAQMPWNGATALLYGQVAAFCTRHGFRSPELEDSDSHPARNGLPKAETRPCGPLRPPDLIIQDELHLISGPLGTLVGLYETAVDHLASWTVDGRVIRPKVIASTATIRQARAQVHSLFLRRVAVFPPQGIDVEDNFFSLQRPVDELHPGRLYLGICAPGKRLKAVLIRVYVAYMAAAQQLFEKYDSSADPWMTLVGYFNSMRELGGMRRLVEDDVRSRLQKTEERGLARRRAPIMEELTSRMASTGIPALLDRLEQIFDPEVDSGRGKRVGRKGTDQPPALDVLLATNMISVGVDVQRLGLMVVAGQPKSTSEYIQATSRVGRGFPGLVCTVFNWARPRDLSHYEMFEHYHATFYEHVEPLSITPFAPRALDRGLSALLVSLIRLGGSPFTANKGATHISRDHPLVRAAVTAIMARAAEISADTRDTVATELEARLDEWLAAAGAIGPQSLGYRTASDGLTKGLLLKPSLKAWERFTVLNSLRDVEPTVGLILDEGSLGDIPSWAVTAYRGGDDPREPDEEEDDETDGDEL